MDEPKGEILEALVEIRDTLNRIYICFEDQYLEIQNRKYGEKVEAFKASLTDVRKKVFELLFDQRHLSQGQIAQAAGISQPAVSRFVSLLIEKDLIEQVEEDNKIIYHDKYDLRKWLQKLENVERNNIENKNIK
jgi:predicted transcriptional regulator